jgi:seryl-tRNA synthetase
MSIEVIELFDIFSETFGKEKAQAAVRDIETLISDRKRELATKENIQENELKLTREIELTRGKIQETELKLTREIESVRLEVESVKLEVEKAKSSLVKWFAGLLIAYTGVIVTILTLWK